MTIQIDKKSVMIAALTFTAALLIAANFCWTPKAQAETVKGDQYIAVTARIAQGGEGLYLTNRDGVMAVFVYNPNKKALEVRAIRSVVAAFSGGGAPAGGGRRGY